MRIIGGIYRGRVFTPGKKFNARPTTDQAKEGLFNILENRYDFSELKILDLFSGSGSIGYEFVSRGAKQVTFVEKNKGHLHFIREVVEKLKIENATIVHDDVFRFLKRGEETYDLIFSDPPYDLTRLAEIPQAVFESGLLSQNGMLVLEHPPGFEFTTHPAFRELRTYGKVNFSFFSA